MIDWNNVVTMEPPVIRIMTDADLREFIALQLTATVIFLKLLCHTQAVERVGKLVTETSTFVCGQKSQDGFIFAQITSRQLLPTFETKRDYVILEFLNGKTEEYRFLKILSFKVSFSGKISVYSLKCYSLRCFAKLCIFTAEIKIFAEIENFYRSFNKI